MIRRFCDHCGDEIVREEGPWLTLNVHDEGDPHPVFHLHRACLATFPLPSP